MNTENRVSPQAPEIEEAKLTGKSSYGGMTPEQVIGGWLLRPEVWQNEPKFADRMEKSLRSNKVLQRVLENPATREAFVNSLSAMLDDLKKNEKSNPANE